MNDDQAAAVLEAVLTLAITVRDEGPDAVLDDARAVLTAAGGDALAAITVAAAAIRLDAPIDAWWQGGQPTLPAVVDIATLLVYPEPLPDEPGRKAMQPHGTHSAFNRHKKRGEEPCEPCVIGERSYQRVRHEDRRRANRSAAA